MQPEPVLDDLKSVTCPNCGATLTYKPGTTSLVCEFCASSFQIQLDKEASLAAQKENDLLAAMNESQKTASAGLQVYVVKCPACGAESAMEQNIFSSACAFCGSSLTVKPDVRAIANPQAVLPFKLEKKAAAEGFNTWLKRLWFAPNDLKKTAFGDRFNGVYLPFWTFDAQTVSNYVGQRGDHYTETVRRVVDGKEVLQKVVKTRWSGARGQVQRLFNDLLVTASRALDGKYLNALEPWDLSNLAPYDNRFLTGFTAEVCQVDIKEGFNQAKGIMTAVIQQDVRQQIGGNEQRITALQTNYGGLNYKYVLLPVWLSVYRYGSKVYHFVVNARTGEVHGERPYSVIKIVLAILAALVVLFIFITVFGNQ